ncbi:MAG: hypothetical protein K2M12_09480, partial [Muribaculaceae bacterium]|nr:hypothetical protein [Muribaculaceae bacterium]
GLILGFPDAAGAIMASVGDYPWSVRCLGYEATTVTAPCDTVYMQDATFPLPEVVVTPADRPITRVLTYAREYCTGTTGADTMQLYCEYMLEYFFADGKVKGFSKTHESGISRAVRRYGRIADSQGRDSVMQPRWDDDIASLSFLENMAFVPFEPREETGAMKDGALSDTVGGKFYPKFVYRKNDRFFTVDCDALADYKDHRWSPLFFKLLGLTMDMEAADYTLIYNYKDSGRYELRDFISGTYNLRILGRGKLLKRMLGVKDAISMYCYMEQYPVDIERLTVEEYKEMKKDYYARKEEFRVPANVLPLAPAMRQLVERADREIPVQKK